MTQISGFSSGGSVGSVISWASLTSEQKEFFLSEGPRHNSPKVMRAFAGTFAEKFGVKIPLSRMTSLARARKRELVKTKTKQKQRGDQFVNGRARLSQHN